MTLDRYNTPVVKSYFRAIFDLQNFYFSTLDNIARIDSELNVPAGVVGDIDEKAIISRRNLAKGDLEIKLIEVERLVPQDLTAEENVACLLSDVRCYLYF